MTTAEPTTWADLLGEAAQQIADAEAQRDRLIREAAAKAADAVVERDRLIREAAQHGMSIRQIAAATGTLSYSGVKRIIDRDPSGVLAEPG